MQLCQEYARACVSSVEDTGSNPMCQCTDRTPYVINCKASKEALQLITCGVLSVQLRNMHTWEEGAFQSGYLARDWLQRHKGILTFILNRNALEASLSR
jgi:hypothetical protein